jgi:hypothetical protein
LPDVWRGGAVRASDKKLSMALRKAGLDEMATRAEAGYYNEFFGPLDTPELQLADDLAKIGTPKAMAVRRLVIDGEFDAGSDESEEWAQSPEGKAAFGRLISKL